MNFVFDSSPLIYFAKIGILDKIARLKGEKIIPHSVYTEVVEEGTMKGKKDAIIIESFVNKHAFVLEKAKGKILQNFLKFQRLKLADAETLAIAKEKKAVAIIDDLFLRAVAETNDIDYGGSIFILFKLCREKGIGKHEIKKYVDEMIKLGWRCSTELYAQILEEIDIKLQN